MPISDLQRTVHHVVDTLRNARERGCSLLIGAGCSATADIPLASGIVQEFKQRYPNLYEQVPVKSYAHCMAQLAYDERSRLIAPYIDRAKVNWAHVAIAQLTKAGYVTRILTTNFDPLIIKACTTVGVFPAVYDLAASHEFRAERVYEPSVFYLHGQRAGFVTLHTDEEVGRHKETLHPVFEDAGRGRVWIVCGYSGDNDPVFDHLADVRQFGCPLYWVGYKDESPAQHVRERLLVPDKYAFHVSGHDADSFFIELARQLDCFPPAIVSKPFTHLLEVTDLLAPYTLASATEDLRQVARTRIQAAIDQFEKGEAPSEETKALSSDALDATTLLFSGKYDEVLALYEAAANPTEELRDAASWALINQGVELYDHAAGDTYNSNELLRAACDKYAAALRIKPDKHEALNNWGLTLAEQASTKSGAQADALWKTASEKYEAALRIKPDKHEALYNWGIALAAQARTKSGAEADALWAATHKKYEAALQIKPDNVEALMNWAIAIVDQARTVTSPEIRESLLLTAMEKCKQANDIVPGKGSYGLACIYCMRGDLELCRMWLVHSKDHGKMPNREHVMNDSDLVRVRDQPWFAELVAQ